MESIDWRDMCPCVLLQTFLQVRGQRQRARPDLRPPPGSATTITTTRPPTMDHRTRTTATPRNRIPGAEAVMRMWRCMARQVSASDHDHRVPLGSRRCVNVTIDLITMKWVHAKFPLYLSICPTSSY